MADNTTLNPGVGGDVVRDEDIGGIKYPISKIYLGAAGVDGGPVTNANPFPTSVQGSVTCTGTVAITAAALPLPAGAATEATLANVLTTAAFQARTPVVGQAAMAASSPVVIASDQAAFPVNATCSGTVAVSSVGGNVTVTQATGTNLHAVIDSGAVTVSGTVTANQGTANATPWIVKEFRSATGTQSSVAGSASSVTLLASNANRLGAVVNNDSTAILYVKLGATASATSYTAKLFTDDMYEVPFGYTGVIDGIWASATGNARITELT